MKKTPFRTHHIPVLFLFGLSAVFLFSILSKPELAVSQATPVVIFLTSGASWTVPADWNNSQNTIEVIGGGGGGKSPTDGAGGGGYIGTGGGGGGGGAYSSIVNLALAPGSSVQYSVGSGGTAGPAAQSGGDGGDTWFNGTSLAGSSVGAKGGLGGTSQSGALGGSATAGVGTVRHSGGNGGSGGNSNNDGGGGGGGSAGPSGDGMNGGNGGAGAPGGGGGGGGANGGSSTVGFNAFGVSGAAGGSGNSGTGGGSEGAPHGGSGATGGGGGGADGAAPGGNGGNGGQQLLWTQGSGAGPGGGGGGGGGSASSGSPQAGYGGQGGGYGGGGGGGADGNTVSLANNSSGGVGAQGVIVITYIPFIPDPPTYTLTATADTDSINLTWATPASDGGSPITGYKIYRDTTAGATTLLATVGVTTAYDDTTATPNTTYYYRVRATNSVGDFAYSNEDSAAIAPPSAQCTLVPGGTPITGYAWSDTVGWLDMSCQNSGTCATSDFGLSIADDGSISGCAWSENVGWVSAAAEDLTGCPSGTCNARMDELALRGWMKVVNASDAQSGGWDGFISLSGTSPAYGPTLASSTLSGYAWGDTNVGWVSFNAGTAYDPVQTTWLPTCATQYACTDTTHRQSACTNAPIEACNPGLICSAGACVLPPAPFTAPGSELKVSPNLASYHQTVVVSWDVQEADSCTVTENNPDFTDTWDTLSGAETSSPITRVTTYTLSCTGPGGDLTQTATVSRRPEWREI